MAFAHNIISLFAAVTLFCFPTIIGASSLEDIIIQQKDYKLRPGDGEHVYIQPYPAYIAGSVPTGRLVVLRDFPTKHVYGFQKKFDSLSGGTFGLQKRDAQLEVIEKSS